MTGRIRQPAAALLQAGRRSIIIPAISCVEGAR